MLKRKSEMVMINSTKDCPHKGTVGYELRSLHNMLQRKVDEKSKANFDGYITEIHMWIMVYLIHNPDRDIFQKDLEAEFEVRRSTMTGILNTMEKNGLLVRVSVNYDARLKKLTLTEKAKEYLNKNLLMKMQFESAMVNGIDETDLEIFFKVIGKIKQNIIDFED